MCDTTFPRTIGCASGRYTPCSWPKAPSCSATCCPTTGSDAPWARKPGRGGATVDLGVLSSASLPWWVPSRDGCANESPGSGSAPLLTSAATFCFLSMPGAIVAAMPEALLRAAETVFDLRALPSNANGPIIEFGASTALETFEVRSPENPLAELRAAPTSRFTCDHSSPAINQTYQTYSENVIARGTCDVAYKHTCATCPHRIPTAPNGQSVAQQIRLRFLQPSPHGSHQRTLLARRQMLRSTPVHR